MPQLETIVPTTELEAVNLMLGAVGEAPIAGPLDTAAPLDTQLGMAVNILRDRMRETQMRGWKFNTRMEYRIANSTVDGEEGFTVPTDLLRFDITQRYDQMGAYPQKQTDGTFSSYPALLDLAATGRSPTTTTTRRFVDRLTNSRVIAAADRPQIFIDGVFSINFEDMPESARNFVVKRSAIEFAQSTIGDPVVEGYTQDDLRAAWINLLHDQSDARQRNFMDTTHAYNIRGRRPRRF